MWIYYQIRKLLLGNIREMPSFKAKYFERNNSILIDADLLLGVLKDCDVNDYREYFIKAMKRISRPFKEEEKK